MKTQHLCAITLVAALAAIAFRTGLIVTPQAHLELVNEVRREVRERYVDRQLAQEMDRALQQQIENGERRGFTNAISLPRDLTATLRGISGDPHFSIGYSFTSLDRNAGRAATPEELAEEALRQSSDNFGLRQVRLLPENVGYIELTRFAAPEWLRPALAAAMEQVSGARALIIDLRENHGGSSGAAVLLASYFFARPVHWVDFQTAGGMEARWTLAAVPGPRFLDRPLCLLTSSRTFSAAEGFAYHMKNLRRATIVGERTRGGANPGFQRRIHEHYWMFLPAARAVSPITHTNWENVGVTPDIEAPGADALDAALERLRGSL